MKLRYQFSERDFLELCRKNIERNKTTIFEDIYEALLHFLKTPDFISITNFKFKYYDYYDEHLSLKEYINKGGISLPYIEFHITSDKDADLDITEIVGVEIPQFIKLNTIQYSDVVESVRIKTTKLKTKNKASIKLLSVEIPATTLRSLYLKTNPSTDLIPSYLGVWEWRQTFYNKITGEVFFCSCFENALAKDSTRLPIRHPHLEKALKYKLFRDSICHICTNTNSDLIFCHKMYGSAFKVKYGAYIAKHSMEKCITEREAENEIRALKGVAKIGEKWINETLLFNYISLLFPQFTIQREASPLWLKRLRFDVYIPELNLAIEYQGKQHYVAVDFFGGKEGLKKTKERDKEKLELSKLHGVHIVYFTYKENLTERLVLNRLKEYIKEQ